MISFNNTDAVFVKGNLLMQGRGDLAKINSVEGSMTFVSPAMDNSAEYQLSAYPTVNASSLMRFINVDTYHRTYSLHIKHAHVGNGPPPPDLGVCAKFQDM